MEEIERLRILILHWIEHNKEHSQEYMRWAEKAKANNRRDLAAILNRLSAETERMNHLLDEALRLF